MTYLKHKKKLVAMVFITLSHACSAQQDLCEKAKNDGSANIDSVYLPKIDLWTKVAKAMQDKGFDPRRYPVIMPDGSIEVLDITDVVQKLIEQRSNGFAQVFEGVRKCERALEPYQKILDTAVFICTTGLSAVLPPSMTSIDASQLLNGHPLGGPGALIPSVRDGLLNGLGISGSVRKMLEDPLCVVRGNC